MKIKLILNWHLLFILLVVYSSLNLFKVTFSACDVATGYEREIKSVWFFGVNYYLIYPKITSTTAGKIVQNGVIYSNTCSRVYYCLCMNNCLIGTNPNTANFYLVSEGISCQPGYQCKSFSDGTSYCLSNSNSCSDDDGGKNYFTKGKVTFNGYNYFDSCSQAQLLEYFCYYQTDSLGNVDVNLGSEFVYCPSGYMCDDGQCVDINRCYDSDFGINTDTAGFVKKGNSEIFDVCVGQNIREYYCDAYNNIQSIEMVCPAGKICENGRCREVVCTDSDNGISKNVPGTTSNETQTKYDVCVDSSKIKEYSCNPDKTIKETILVCDQDYSCATWLGYPGNPAFCGYCNGPTAIDLYNQRTTSNSSGFSFTDTCISQNRYRKAYCNGFTVQIIEQDCPQGYQCFQGKCEQIVTCSDTDGIDKDRLGKVTYNSIDYFDYCANVSHVSEYYCSNNIVQTTNISCNLGACLNGQCVYNICADTDNGIHIEQYGEVKKDNVILKDSCYNLTTINETYCSFDQPTSSLYDCYQNDHICQDGMCVPLQQGQCIDTDNGKVLTSYGETVALNDGYRDICYNLTHVIEGYCNNGKAYTEITYCGDNYFCSKGVCKLNDRCIDTDEGNNYLYSVGQAGRGSIILSDYCVVEGGKMLKEAMCSNDNPVYSEYSCPLDYICHDGRCVNLQNQCIDSDNGLNKLVNGSTSNSTHTIFDKCVDINRVNETYCPSSGTIIQTQVLTCDSNQVCLNGKCVIGDQCTRIEAEKKTTNGTVTLQDFCIDSNNLNYSYCGNNNEVLTKIVTCQPGYRCDQQKKECIRINQCTDSDANEENPLLKPGTTTNGTNTFSDSCDPADIRKVIEYYCINSEDNPDDNSISFFSMLCPNNYICNNGACVIPSCTDSDEENVNIFGAAYNITNTLEDKCVPSDPTKVDEAICDNTFVKYKRLSCEEGHLCDDGKCVPSSGDMCIENDNGKDAFTYGIVYAISASGTTDIFSDECIDSKKVKEYYCESPSKLTVKEEIITCPDDYVCSFGACKQITCSDSDAGMVIDEKGITGLMVDGNYLTNPSPVEDFCTNNILTEYYCQNNEIKSSNIDCASYDLFCLNGMCIDCLDSDGDNPYADGYSKNGTVTLSDKCEIITDPNGNQRAKVTEYVCEGKLIKSKIYFGNVGSFCSLNNLGNPTFMNSPSQCIEFFDTDGRKIVRFQSIEYREHCAPNELAIISYQCLSPNGPVKEIQIPCQVGTKCPYTLDYSYFTCNSISKTCSDSDNGNFYGIPGQVKITQNGMITYYKDQCTNDGTNRILEATCDGNNIRYIINECRDTCKVDANGRAFCLNVIDTDIPQNFNQIIPNVPNSFTVCFPLILLTVFFALVLTYMVAKGLGMMQLEQIAKNEFVELGNSLIQLVILVSLFSISSNFTLPDSSPFINTAVLILDNINYHFASYYRLVITN
ncbi:MAG: hypothetical protein QW076_03610, partial [Candidatus Anstonellales archaeon]